MRKHVLFLKTCRGITIKEMDDVAPAANNIVPIIPVIQPSPRGNIISVSPSVRNSPSIPKGPLAPIAPITPRSLNNQGTLSLRMPNIANTRPLTSPVNMQRSTSATTNAVTIPSNVSSRISDYPRDPSGSAHRSPVNISGDSRSSTLINITPNNSTEVSRNPSRTTSTQNTGMFDSNVVRLPSSPPRQFEEDPKIAQERIISTPVTDTIGSPNETSRNGTSTNRGVTYPGGRISPPTLSANPASLQNINMSVNTELAISAAQPPPKIPDPIIKREEIIPINNRPLSPRDSTTITLHGVPLNRETITPIELDTDSDDDDDLTEATTDLVNMSIRPPINIPTIGETTTIDSTEDTIRTTMNGPMRACQPLIPVRQNEPDIMIRPASPTTQVNVPIVPISILSPINTEVINDSQSIISPAPPVTSLNRNLSPDNNINSRLPSDIQAHKPQPIQPPIANRIPNQGSSRGRQSLPITSQPTQIQPPTLPSSTLPSSTRQPAVAIRQSTQLVQPTQPATASTHPTTASTHPTTASTEIPYVNTTAPGARQPIQLNSTAPGVRQPIQLNSTAPGLRQPVPLTTTAPAPAPGLRQPVPLNNNVYGLSSARAPVPTSSQTTVPTSSQTTVPTSTQTTVPISSQTTVPTYSQTTVPTSSQTTVPTSSTTNAINSGVAPVRQPVPLNSNAPGFRQPVPLNTNMPGIRQPVPLASNVSRPGGQVESQREVNSSQSEPPRGATSKDTSAQRTSTPAVKTSDVQPIPTTLPAASSAPILPPPNVPNYSGMTPEEQAQHRANFRTRFGILRNAWPNYHIPDVPDDIPLEQVHAQYDIYVRHIHISRDVDQYKVYLVIMWLLIELFCTKIGLNIGGYTVAQMRSMNKYERLLIELGETNYKSSGAEAATHSNWPVEVRIFFMALVNAVTFIIIKMLANYIGEGMATTIVDGLSSYLSGSPPQPGQVLFGGATQPNTKIAGANGPAPGGAPLPQVGGPFGGIDVASLLGNLGSMFLRGQGPLAGNAPTATAPAVQPSTAGPQTPTTPRFRPAYDE